MGAPFAMNARMIMTSGTVSYAPPVCPDKPRAPASAVKKTIVSRHNWMFCRSTAFWASVSVLIAGSSLRGWSLPRSIGNVSVFINRV